VRGQHICCWTPRTRHSGQLIPDSARAGWSLATVEAGLVWTAPDWQRFSLRMQHWSEQPCVRPLSAAHVAACHMHQYLPTLPPKVRFSVEPFEVLQWAALSASIAYLACQAQAYPEAQADWSLAAILHSEVVRKSACGAAPHREHNAVAARARWWLLASRSLPRLWPLRLMRVNHSPTLNRSNRMCLHKVRCRRGLVGVVAVDQQGTCSR
jgi:hypothetical protein